MRRSRFSTSGSSSSSWRSVGRDRPQRRGDETRKRARVVDVRRRELELGRQIRREADDLREQALDVPGQRLDLRRVVVRVGQRRELPDEVGLAVDRLDELDPVEAADEDPKRPVGDLDHLVDDRDRSDLVDVVEAGRVDRGVARGDECEEAVAGDDVVDQADRALLPDRERHHRLREDDRVLQRQDRQRRRQLDLRLGVVRDLEAEVRHRELHRDRVSGSRQRLVGDRQRDRDDPVLVPWRSRASGSTSSASRTWRWNWPYSISICW